ERSRGLDKFPDDILTNLCFVLDVKALVQLSLTCRRIREVGLGQYPWRRLCVRRWGLQELVERK
ncbi:unnamed protein product, partial [Choristocarpus tenellus]